MFSQKSQSFSQKTEIYYDRFYIKNGSYKTVPIKITKDNKRN